MKNNFVKILELTHLSKDGKILSRQENLLNIIHKQGSEFMCRALFDTSAVSVPQLYYFGLDNRSEINFEDTMTTILNSEEPLFNGYARQSADSASDFNVFFSEGFYQAESPILTFFASSGSWGPVQNLFLTNSNDYDGYLISSVPLEESITMNDGELIRMKMIIGLTLLDDSD